MILVIHVFKSIDVVLYFLWTKQYPKVNPTANARNFC